MLFLHSLMHASFCSPATRVFRTSNNGASLDVRISLTKEDYLLYEPIACAVWIKNVSAKPTDVFFASWSGWVVVDEKGKRYKPVPMIDHFRPRQINPGDSLGGQFNPMERLNEGLLVSKDAYPRYVLPKGQYHFWYKLYGDSAFLRFEVKEPRGSEATALKLYLEARGVINEYTLSANFPDTGARNRQREAILKLLQLATKYHNSVYAVPALRLAEVSAVNVVYDSKLRAQIHRRLLQEYPEVAMGFLYYLNLQRSVISTYRWGDQRIQKLRSQLFEIIQVSRDEKVQKRAREILNEIDSKIVPDTTVPVDPKIK